MKRESESFREEYYTLSEPGADAEVTRELNEMGSVKEVQDRHDKEAWEAYVREQVEYDEKASNPLAKVEKKDLEEIARGIYELMDQCGVPGVLSLNAVCEKFTHTAEIEDLVKRAEGGRFANRPDQVVQLVKQLRNLESEGLVAPSMSLVEALEVLEEKVEKGHAYVARSKELEWVDEGHKQLERENKKREAVFGLFELVRQALNDGDVKNYVIEHRPGKDVDWLIVTLRPRKPAMDLMVSKFQERRDVLGGSIENNGKKIVISVPVQKETVDETEERFPDLFQE